MGLDTTHDCFHGSYSGFHEFRCALARVIGIDLERMVGFQRPSRDPEPDAFTWEGLPPDPLHVLLNHSDCDGVIGREHQLPLAARLEEVAEKIEDAQGYHDPGYHRKRALKFAAGLRQAHAANETVEFM